MSQNWHSTSHVTKVSVPVNDTHLIPGSIIQLYPIEIQCSDCGAITKIDKLPEFMTNISIECLNCHQMLPVVKVNERQYKGDNTLTIRFNED